MAASIGMLAQWRSDGEAATDAGTEAARSPDQMIAGCEYELRQLRREVLATRDRGATAAMTAAVREPFVLGARLRNEDFRAKLAAISGTPNAKADPDKQ